MDEDFAFDDTVGMQTVELDDLPIDEEKNMEIKFKKVTSTASTSTLSGLYASHRIYSRWFIHA